jgi:hypothetical protein
VIAATPANNASFFMTDLMRSGKYPSITKQFRSLSFGSQLGR